MRCEFSLAERTFAFDLAKPLDISVPLTFNENQPNSYDVPKASARAYRDGNFIGDVREGGSCNFDEIKLIPHCNGTHTECIGHISEQRIALPSVLKRSFFRASVITITPEDGLASGEKYNPVFEKGDQVISKKGLVSALKNVDSDFTEALVIRTTPNSSDKKKRRYSKRPAPFFSHDAMQFVVEYGVEHLIIDLPSVDRAFDGGLLSAHRIFWGIPIGQSVIPQENISNKTITEFAFIPDSIPDNRYMIDLQVAPFHIDAAPSRPTLYELLSS